MEIETYKEKVIKKVKIRVAVEDLLVDCESEIFLDSELALVELVLTEEFGAIRVSENSFKIWESFLEIGVENNLIKITKKTCIN